MISQVFHEGRVFRNCHNHVHSPPHSAYLYPHQLRRKKAAKVSWAATSFKDCFGPASRANGKSREFAHFLGLKRVLEDGPNWLSIHSIFGSPSSLYISLMRGTAKRYLEIGRAPG